MANVLQVRAEHRASTVLRNARFEPVDARFEQVERRLDQMDRRFEVMDQRMDEGFKETAAAIARPEGLIHGHHGTARATAGHPVAEPEQFS